MILIFNVDTSLAEGRSGAAGSSGPIHCDLRDDVDIDNAVLSKCNGTTLSSNYYLTMAIISEAEHRLACQGHHDASGNNIR